MVGGTNALFLHVRDRGVPTEAGTHCQHRTRTLTLHVDHVGQFFHCCRGGLIQASTSVRGQLSLLPIVRSDQRVNVTGSLRDEAPVPIALTVA